MNLNFRYFLKILEKVPINPQITISTAGINPHKMAGERPIPQSTATFVVNTWAWLPASQLYQCYLQLTLIIHSALKCIKIKHFYFSWFLFFSFCWYHSKSITDVFRLCKFIANFPQTCGTCEGSNFASHLLFLTRAPRNTSTPVLVTS